MSKWTSRIGADGLAILRQLNGPRAGHAKRLTNRPMVFGRHRNCDVALRNQLVSRQHAKLYRHGSDYYIEDIGSSNGTIVNGKRLVGARRLQNKDWIEIGTAIFEFSDELAFPNADSVPSNGKQRQTEESVESPTVVDSEAPDEATVQASPQVRLQAVLQIARGLANCFDVGQIQQRILECTLRVFPNAVSVCMLDVNEVTGKLIPVATQKRSSPSDSTLTPGRVPRALVERAIRQQTAVASEEVSQSTVTIDVLSFMCAPIIGACRELLGLVYLEFRDDRNRKVNEDKDLLTCIAALAAQSLEHARTHGGRYRAVVNASAQAILTINERGVIESANPATERIFDCDTEKLINQHIAVLVPELEIGENEKWTQRLQSYLTQPGQPPREAIGRRVDGTHFPIELSLAKFKLAGQCHSTLICQDITVRKRSEKALRDSRERLSRIVQTGVVGIAFGNSQGAIIEVNNAFCLLTGYTREELVEQGTSWKSLTAPEFAEADRKALAALRENGVYGPYEKEYIRKDGRRLPISVSAAVLPDRADEHVVFIVDNSRRKRAEQELRALNAALESTVVDRTRNVRLLQDVAVIANEAESVQEAFRTAVETICRHAGWPAGRAFLHQSNGASSVFQQVGPWHWDLAAPSQEERSPERLIQRVISSGRPARLDNLTEMANYFGPAVENPRQVKSAYAFPVKLGAKVWGVLEFLVTPDTSPSNELLHAMTHLCTQLGRVIERRQLQQELIDAVWNQHSRFGQELHDSLGQELTGIRMMAETLRSKLGAKSLPEAEAAAQLTQFIQDAQDHTRQISKGLFPVDIFEHGLTAALAELADHTSAHAGDLQCKFVSDHSIQIGGNELATHLFRIAQEAVNNAIKHSHARKIEISLCKVPPRLTLEISDDGIGISEADMVARRGMGLQIMRYRASAIGGLLSFHSDADRGTKVRCILECSPDNEESSRESRHSAADCG